MPGEEHFVCHHGTPHRPCDLLFGNCTAFTAFLDCRVKVSPCPGLLQVLFILENYLYCTAWRRLASHVVTKPSGGCLGH